MILSLKDYIKKAQRINSSFELLLNKCNNLLFYDNNAIDALQYIRGRFEDKNINKFKFGFFPKDDLIFKLYNNNINEDLLLNLRLIFKYKSISSGVKIKSIFEHHPLIFPIKDEFGYIIGFIGRTLLTKEQMKEMKISKYKYSLFSRNHIIYNLDVAKESIAISQKVYLVEGQIDCLSLNSKGLYNVVALGGLGLNKYQFYLLRKYGGPNLEIKLLLDNDAPGNLEAQKISNEYSKYCKISKISLPDEQIKDIDEYIKKHNNISFLLR